ncbi:MAG: aminoacyl-tRNA hydrolase [Bdellovibrio sp.]|nr:aminoacyl-tRNA hydrolase [Bdellovibrio sp.]
MPKLIVGLGNPGRNYSRTRHNIGWMVLDRVTSSNNLIWKDKFKGSYLELTGRNEKIFFLKPKTFMNKSGESVVEFAQFYKIPLSDVIIIHDDMDTPFGTITFKSNGGAAGHNGIKSIIEKTGTQEFKRLRMGIGRPIGDMISSSFVLSGFNPDEEKLLEAFLNLASDAINCYINENFEKASSLYSRKTVLPS